MKKVIVKLICSNKNAFIRGRQIVNAAFVANECIDHHLKRKKAGVICKLDDHVSWPFLLVIMRQMKFGEKWIQWISTCISKARFSVLINGDSEGFSNPVED